MTARTHCRVCQSPFFSEPLLLLENMPCAAQNFPDLSNVESDSGQDLELCQCRGCGLVQLSNSSVGYHKDVIRASAFSEEMQDFRIDQFNKFVTDHNLQGKKVLEVGCGKGEYLSLIEKAGAEAYGVEHLAESVEYCQAKNLKVSQGYLTDSSEAYNSELSSGPFSAFFIMNFFEHLPDPNAMLDAITNNLIDYAIGLIEVPNFDMILEQSLFSEFINDHLFYFTEESLRSTLNYNGFEVIQCHSIWHDYILSATVRRKQPKNLTFLSTHQEKITREIHQFLDKHNGKKIAVWGAGHQSLAVLSLTGMSSRIESVFDSAPFKQDKFTPATHIPIKNPDELDEEVIEVIIIMAASYSDEVFRTIRTKWGTKFTVAILRDYGLEIVSD